MQVFSGQAICSRVFDPGKAKSRIQWICPCVVNSLQPSTRFNKARTYRSRKVQPNGTCVRVLGVHSVHGDTLAWDSGTDCRIPTRLSGPTEPRFGNVSIRRSQRRRSEKLDLESDCMLAGPLL